MNRQQVPNALTGLRLVFSAALFTLLALYQHDPAATYPPAMLVALALFILAAVTDALDGHLARKWDAETAFGRVADPVADKVLILGTAIFLAGPAFATPQAQVTGLAPWMAVVMLLREFLVTAIRSEVESRGVKFGANLWGKLKMILQSVVLPCCLFFAWAGWAEGSAWAWLRDALVWAMVIATAASAVPYVTGAVKALRAPSDA
ncbi:MAG: CDP-diacylglycerol--glycerol-3-phosphate 3-phosphatidyltransferase [Planctomycetota bacterium]